MKFYFRDGGRACKGTTGYCIIAREYAKALYSLGHEVFVMNPQPDPKDKYAPGNYDISDDPILVEIVEKSKSFIEDDNTIYLWISPPYSFRNVDSKKINIGITQHELDHLPPDKKEWVGLCNQMNCIVTPHQFNREMWIKEGVKVPVYVCPLGINTKQFNRGAIYKILMVHEGLGNSSSREDWSNSIYAINKAFSSGAHTNVEVTIKTWNWDKTRFEEFLSKFSNMPKITVNDKRISNYQMVDFYKNHHVFLKNSLRDGWCYPLMEAIHCGMTCIVNPYPSLMSAEFFNDKCVFFNGFDDLVHQLKYDYEKWRSQFEWDWEIVTLDLIQVLNS